MNDGRPILVIGIKEAVGEQWKYYAEPVRVLEDRLTRFDDGDEVDLDDRTPTAHEVPGHAPHEQVFRDADTRIVYISDSAGVYVPEVDTIWDTSPLSQFDLDQAGQDASTIADPDLLPFAHFGPWE